MTRNRSSGPGGPNLNSEVFRVHEGGKISVTNKRNLATRKDLSLAYTPGVAEVSLGINRHPALVHSYTVKGNMVAVVTDGTAVLGLGDIGPEAALPVMEGKAMLFKEFGGVDAFPVCVRERDCDKFVSVVEAIEPVFGGINLEDIAAPRCFEIEEKLKKVLSIPVFHDDQHGTAVVVLAALLNSLRITKKRMEDIKVVVSGAGAAGVACVRMMHAAGVRTVLMCDREGLIYRGRRAGMNGVKREMAKITNSAGEKGGLETALRGADVFLGVSAAGLVRPEWLRGMKPDAAVFALANPVPEVMPEEASRFVRIIATGRSDYPNQINNVLCFPGLFRGLLDCRAREVNEAMKIAAARALAGVVKKGSLDEKHIVPSVFDRSVAPSVADAVMGAARRTGVATCRKHRGGTAG